MEYQERTVQRIFTIRFSEGERLIESLENFVREKNIQTGFLIMVGAFLKGNIVLGFKKHSRIYRDFDRCSFDKHHEVGGVGTISWVDGKPKIHFHATLAREREVFLAHIVESEVAGAEIFVVETSGAAFTSSALL
jgi:predicted DNA-binding protein with PD1-like motif